MALARSLVALTLVLAIFSSVASANFIATTHDPVSLASLAGKTFTVSDKVFSNFSLFGFSLGGAFKPSLEGIFVQGGYDDQTGNVGLRFITSWTAGAGQLLNAKLGFDVAVADDGRSLIEDVSMVLSDASATGASVIAASETVTGPTGAILAQLSVSKQVGDGNFYLCDHADFRPVGTIHVSKDFSVVGGAFYSIDGGTLPDGDLPPATNYVIPSGIPIGNGVAHVSGFYQYFSQVPEPASLALLGFGATAILAHRKR